MAALCHFCFQEEASLHIRPTRPPCCCHNTRLAALCCAYTCMPLRAQPAQRPVCLAATSSPHTHCLIAQPAAPLLQMAEADGMLVSNPAALEQYHERCAMIAAQEQELAVLEEKRGLARATIDDVTVRAGLECGGRYAARQATGQVQAETCALFSTMSQHAECLCRDRRCPQRP